MLTELTTATVLETFDLHRTQAELDAAPAVNTRKGEFRSEWFGWAGTHFEAGRHLAEVGTQWAYRDGYLQFAHGVVRWKGINFADDRQSAWLWGAIKVALESR